ncbi:molecular chaperone HscC [Sphingomonas zeicaulis]|uniref:Hsp70 family protein n=1 Tax=Sphingomonas zeicaulis TaxID=1632740 RepID=UPI003D1DBBAB
MIIGIDLGTTNSAAAIWRDGQSVLIPNSLGDLLTPSAVGLTDDGEVLVGMAARDRQPTHPKLTGTVFKRLMGTHQPVRIGRRDFSPEELSALVLRNIKADAEAFTGETVDQAVITVPAYFNDRQRKATRRAGQLAGLNVERLINEPTAAALAYGIHERDDGAPFLVFDLGGGTFDVSIVEIFDGIIEVRASAGDNRLGGEDFNHLMVQLVREKIDPKGRLSDPNDPAVAELMRAAAERTRRALTDRQTAPFSLIWKGEAFEAEVDADEFEQRCEPLIARLREPVLRSLRDSNIKVDGLSEIIMVGGATRMPVVRRAVTRMFGRFPNTTLHPDHAVALGAAVQAGLKSRDAALKEIRLTDVCPFTLGVDTAERDFKGNVRTGIFSPIIERNTVLPASRVNIFSTMQDNQREVLFNVYQGEARDVSANVHLGKVSVPVPRGPAGTVAIECRFSYDASGLLEVDVTVPQTGTTRQLVICDEEDAAADRDIEGRRKALAALKLHPREEDRNAAALARAGRCYESLLGERRDYIGKVITHFLSVLDAQEPRAIEEARGNLETLLDEIEGERYL